METIPNTITPAIPKYLFFLKTITRVKIDKLANKVKIPKQKKTVKPDRKPHGFAVDSKVSDLLCEFMSVPAGSLVARTAVTQRLAEYIKEKNLQNSKNKRQVIPDETLTELFGEAAKDQYLTHFNIQKYINHHFIKSSPVPEVTGSV